MTPPNADPNPDDFVPADAATLRHVQEVGVRGLHAPGVPPELRDDVRKLWRLVRSQRVEIAALKRELGRE